MPGFPQLTPAFTAHVSVLTWPMIFHVVQEKYLTCQLVVLDDTVSVGSVSKGAPLTVVPFISEDSFIRSDSSYPIKIDAVFIHGSDFIRSDPSGKHSRLDVTSILKDKSGAIISFKYSGVLSMTPSVLAVLAGGPDAKTTEFGNAFTHVLLETGAEELRAIEEKVYVGSGRFIVENGKPTVVEYLISEVVSGV